MEWQNDKFPEADWNQVREVLDDDVFEYVTAVDLINSMRDLINKYVGPVITSGYIDFETYEHSFVHYTCKSYEEKTAYAAKQIKNRIASRKRQRTILIKKSWMTNLTQQELDTVAEIEVELEMPFTFEKR